MKGKKHTVKLNMNGEEVTEVRIEFTGQIKVNLVSASGATQELELDANDDIGAEGAGEVSSNIVKHLFGGMASRAGKGHKSTKEVDKTTDKSIDDLTDDIATKLADNLVDGVDNEKEIDGLVEELADKLADEAIQKAYKGGPVDEAVEPKEMPTGNTGVVVPDNEDLPKDKDYTEWSELVAGQFISECDTMPMGEVTEKYGLSSAKQLADARDYLIHKFVKDGNSEEEEKDITETEEDTDKESEEQ